MCRPRKRFFFLASAIVAVIAVAYILTRPEPLEDRVRHIQPGMTRAEVEKVLGAPPGIHYEIGFTEMFDPATEGPEWEHWRWDEGHVGVRFDPAGHVDRIDFDPHPPISNWDRLRWRLDRWRWRLSTW